MRYYIAQCSDYLFCALTGIRDALGDLHADSSRNVGCSHVGKLEGRKYNAQTDRMREIYARPGGTQDGDADKRSAHWMSGMSLVLPQKATYPAMSGFGPWRRVILLHLIVEKATEVL